MSFSSTTYNQKLVKWEFISFDSHGEPRVSSPQEVAARYECLVGEAVTDIDVQKPESCEAWVADPLAIGTIVWLGELVDLPSPATALYEVVGCSTVPDVKGRAFEYVLSLSRYKNVLPTVV